jgi:hypothetical protein
VRETLLRSTVLAYVLLIWLAAWPFSGAPGLGSAQSIAQDLLVSASLRPGMRVFPGSAITDTAPYIACVRVLGLSGLHWETLYEPECPPVGTIWYDDPFERAINQMLQGRLRPIYEAPLSASEDAPDAVRHVIEIADYFCHSSDGLDRIVIRRRQHRRNIRDGTRLPPQNQMVCVQECGSPEFSPPQCGLVAISEQPAG